VLRVAQRSRFGVYLTLLLADAGAAQYRQPLGVGGHDSVFDAIVDHLDEVAGAGRSAVKISQFSRSGNTRAPRRARDVPGARGERFENRVEPMHRLIRADDHHAVAALQAPDAAARSHIHVPLGRKFCGPGVTSLPDRRSPHTCRFPGTLSNTLSAALGRITR
jgi:hypothetical protein